VPSPLEEITEYGVTLTELTVTLGIWAVGILVLTLLLKVAVTVKKEQEA
jgi:molybdopterin-containing oxidoreductase family membrane subunit